MLTGVQIRMARAFLRWSADELANQAGVASGTIKRMEADDGFPAARGGNIEAVYKTLVAAGVTFLAETDEGIGVRGKHKAKRSK